MTKPNSGQYFPGHTRNTKPQDEIKVYMAVRISPELHEAITRIARGRTRTETVEQLLRYGLSISGAMPDDDDQAALYAKALHQTGN